MSKTTELAQAEADRAEAELPNDETPEGEPLPPTGEPPVEPGEPQTDEEGEEAEADGQGEQTETPNAAELPRDSLTVSDELNAKREAQAATQADNVKTLADKYKQDVAPCPLCDRVEIAPLLVAKIVAQPAEFWTNMARMGGVEPEPEHAAAEGVVMCDRCNGWGELDYPTRNPHMERQMCPSCTGNGYVLVASEQQTVVSIQPLPSFPTAQLSGAVASTGNDQWGRPPGHPHYNLDPAAVMP
jgi:hypothetical protein